MNTIRVLVVTTLAILLMLFFGSFLLGCSAKPQCVRPVVDLQRPELPTVPADDLQCLKPSAYAGIAMRDATCTGYARELETIIKELAEVPE